MNRPPRTAPPRPVAADRPARLLVWVEPAPAPRWAPAALRRAVLALRHLGRATAALSPRAAGARTGQTTEGTSWAFRPSTAARRSTMVRSTAMGDWPASTS